MAKLKKDDPDTREQILAAAGKVFRAKGYAAARMQEIADEAKINKALLHYYFESKEKLFGQIFLETMQRFFGTAAGLLNDPATSWKEKIYSIADRYTDFLKANPEIPLFVMNEINRNGETFLQQLPIPEMLDRSRFMQQLKEAQQQKMIAPVAPFQIIITVISNLIFPFIAKPMIQMIGGMDEKKFSRFLDERKTLVPDMVIGFLEK